jgi:hypothetical protein
LESGATIDVTQGYIDLAGRRYRTAKSVAIAPSPNEAMYVAKGMSDVTLPGGEIFVATAESTTAYDMARIFASRFGIDIQVAPIFASSIPYQTDLFYDGYLINFIVPGP